MGLVQLSRLGSDPEFSFAVPDDRGRANLLSAEVLVGGDKDLRLQSFIGTDGHANTAELRPAPCHNVYWHMLKIADGLASVNQAMRFYSNKREHPIVAVAQPSLGPGETMGGHVWISLWYNSPISAQVVHSGGLLWSNDIQDYINPRQISPFRIERLSQGSLQRYTDLAKSGDELSLDLCWKKLHYLLHPLEMMLYGSHRQHRSGSGVRDPYVRVPDSHSASDAAAHKKDHAYIRFEYRFPSTWLQHPTLAFAYLGLAKLAVLNWSVLPNLKLLNENNVIAGTIPQGQRASWAELLKRRLSLVQEDKNFRTTRDLRGLTDALAELYNVKLRFPALINFDAWASLRPQQ